MGKCYMLLRSLLWSVVLTAWMAGCSSGDAVEPEPPVEPELPTPPVEEPLWKIDVGVVDYDATVRIRPADAEMTYYFDLCSVSQFEATGLDPEAFAEQVVEQVIALNMEYNGVTAEEVIKAMRLSGEQTRTYEDLRPGMECMVYAFALDGEGKVTSEPQIERFAVPAVEPSDNRITISVKGVTALEAQIEYRTTNNDEYVYDVIPAEVVEGMSDTEIVDLVILNWGENLGQALCRGDHQQAYYDLYPDMEYLAVAFGCRRGTNSTELFTCKFRTAAPGDPQQCRFGFESKLIRAGNMLVQVTSSDPTVSYFWNLYEATMSVDDIRRTIASQIEESVAEGIYADRRYFWLGESTRGDDGYLFMGLDPEKDYRAAAVAVDLTSGEFAGEFVLSETWHCKEEEVEGFSIEVHHDRYFDGDEAAALGGDYAEFAGKALVPFTVETAGAAHYRWIVTEWPEDYESSSDKSLWSQLGWDGYKDVAAENVALEWDKEYTIFAIAENEAGEKSMRFVEEILCTREGASPISELTGSSRPAAQRTAVVSGYRPVAAQDRTISAGKGFAGGLRMPLRSGR